MKNKKLGILAVLVMLVAVSFNAVGGTYAKYISAYSMTDEARVAKWNFNNVAENTVDLFQASYSKDGKVYVASSDAAKVVAPGTSGVYKYDITGTAETNYQVTRVIKVLNRIALTGDYMHEYGAEGYWDIGTGWYNPIEFRIDGANNEDGTEKWVSATKPVWSETETDKDGHKKFLGFELEVEAKDATIYPANYNLSTGDVTGTIEWRWKFSTGTDNDALDTALAQQVDKFDLRMNATVGVTIEQTQDEPNVTVVEGKIVDKAIATFTNIMTSDSDYVNLKVNDYGYVAKNSEDVIFNGLELTGTIYKSSSDYIDRYTGTANTGYYYPITINTQNAKSVKVTKPNGDVVESTKTSFTLLMSLDSENKTPIKYEVTDQKGDVTEYSITYAELVFAVSAKD